MSYREEMTLNKYVDGVLVGQSSSSWGEVRKRRNNLLKLSDLWYLKDRWDGFNTTQKGELNSFRAALRDLPESYDTPAEAWLNMPVAPEWS